jgi:hypothetical protein
MQGWECPRCGMCFSPATPFCTNCKPVTKATVGVDTVGGDAPALTMTTAAPLPIKDPPCGLSYEDGYNPSTHDPWTLSCSKPRGHAGKCGHG